MTGRTLKTGRRPQYVSRSSKQESGMFVFPLEIRHQIYTAMTIVRRKDHLSFLCTCKRSYSEARESFLSRPLNLSDQEELIRLTTQQSPTALRHTQELSLQLTDVEPETMSPFLAQVVLNTSKTAFQHPYEFEERRITCALQAMPNIKSLRLVGAAKAEKSSAPRYLLDRVLSWATQHYANLTHLRVESPNVSLEPLASCHSLTSLHISAVSETPARQMAVILARLTNLVDLCVIAYRRQSYYLQYRDADRPFDPETFRHLRPLRMLRIQDFAGCGLKQHALLTGDMLRAISETHRHSLRRFFVSSSTALKPAVVLQLTETVRTLSAIESLSLVWPEMEPEFLYCLPPSIWSLELLVSDQGHATDMLDTLVAICYRLPVLRKIHFVTSGLVSAIAGSGIEHGQSFHENSSASHRNKERHPTWTLTWSAWPPSPCDRPDVP